jgi:hypothetical protein
MSRSTRFWCIYAHHQELKTALTASDFTVGKLVVAALLVLVWLVVNPSQGLTFCDDIGKLDFPYVLPL